MGKKMIDYSLDLDKVDLKILRILQHQGRISNIDLAKKINLSPPATLSRFKRLEEQGYIDRFVALVDRYKAGLDTLCFVQLSLVLHQPKEIQNILERIIAMPEVLECHNVTGEYDYLLKVIVKNTQALETFISQKLLPVSGIAKVHTSLVLKEFKSSTELELNAT